MNTKSISELRRTDKDSQQGWTENRNIKKVSEMDEILATSSTGVIVETQRPILACSELELWFFAASQNIAGGDTITVKFYKRYNETPVLAETVTVDSPAVTAGQAQKVDVLTTDAEIESYDDYAVSGTTTLTGDGTVAILMGKKTQG